MAWTNRRRLGWLQMIEKGEEMKDHYEYPQKYIRYLDLRTEILPFELGLGLGLLKGIPHS